MNNEFEEFILTLSREVDGIFISLNDARAENERLRAENERLRKLLTVVDVMLDGMYGADIGEDIPVTLIPKDRQELMHEVLQACAEAKEASES